MTHPPGLSTLLAERGRAAGHDMSDTRAVFFDFGGTLFDYETTAPGERACLIELARAAAIPATAQDIRQAYRAALKEVFHQYLPRPYYLHRDMFRDALQAAATQFGTTFSQAQLVRYRAAQHQRREQDFRLRDGVPETLAALRQRGLHLGIVSNADNDQFSHLLHLSRLGPCVDSLLSSEDAQSCKPDPAIFSHALAQAGCAPDQAYFVGDSVQQDIAGANRAGMRSVLIWSRPDTDAPDHPPSPRHVIRTIPEVLDIV